jgi:putative glutamine amidotransferase
LLLPYAEELVGSYLDLCHGLLVAGGDFDPDPALYGATPHPTVKLKPLRTQFELALLRQALERRMPVLGICGGMQLLNVVRGGSLVQDIPSCRPGALEHRSLGRVPFPAHPVRLDPGSALARMVGSTALVVNTSHHQAVDRLGEGLVACAWSEDQMVEAIEDPAYPFCMGTQWHPEYRQTPQEDALMQAFLEAARAYQGRCG